MVKGKLEEAENVSELVIGRYYIVNTVTQTKRSWIIPIHGPLHNDAEVINFPHDHWHIDWRFVNARMYEQYMIAGGGFLMPWAWPINEEYTAGSVTKRRMKCKRQFGPYVPPDRVPWLKKLEDKYRTARMKNFICPHKGIPCNSTPTTDGIVICRGHGLAFNVQTGALVSQFPEAKGVQHG